MTSVTTRHLVVSGIVQGVGFRFATRQEALRLALRGWVRNCPDGSVEVSVSGAPESVSAFEQWLHHGPPGAKVTQVESESIDEDNRLEESRPARFEIVR